MAIISANVEQSVGTSVPFVDLQAQHRALAADIRVAVDEVLTDCNFILGKQVREFEEAFAAYVGVGHAVGVGNGLDALRIALAALDIGPAMKSSCPPIPTLPRRWRSVPWARVWSWWIATLPPTTSIPPGWSGRLLRAPK